MRKFPMIASLLFLGATGLALADTAPMPAAHPHPRIHEVHHRMRDINDRIAMGVKSHKMTKEQAEALRGQLKSIQQEMEADYKTNGKRELTDAQKAQLNQELDGISQQVYSDKHDGAAPPTGGAPVSQ